MLHRAKSTLRELYLEGPNLDDLPDAITELSNLEVLSVVNTFMSDLPAGAYLAKLEVLDLANSCQLSCVPSVLAGCDKLRLLFLDECLELDPQQAIGKYHCMLCSCMYCSLLSKSE